MDAAMRRMSWLNRDTTLPWTLSCLAQESSGLADGVVTFGPPVSTQARLSLRLSTASDLGNTRKKCIKTKGLGQKAGRVDLPGARRHVTGGRHDDDRHVRTRPLMIEARTLPAIPDGPETAALNREP